MKRLTPTKAQLHAHLKQLEAKVNIAVKLLRAPMSGTMGELMDVFADVDPCPQAQPDFSDAHVDRVARRLFRAFDDASEGTEPLHDFDVMAQCEYEGQPVIDNWRALARAAIDLGAEIEIEEDA